MKQELYSLDWDVKDFASPSKFNALETRCEVRFRTSPFFTAYRLFRISTLEPVLCYVMLCKKIAQF
jgi:hypothetical protein